MSIKILKAIRLCIGSQWSSARMNICLNLGIPPIVEQQHSEPTAADQHAPALHQRKLHYNNHIHIHMNIPTTIHTYKQTYFQTYMYSYIHTHIKFLYNELLTCVCVSYD